AGRHPEPFLLTVSTLHPHKNLAGLLRAFAEFRRTHAGYRLVVCGFHGFVSGQIHALRDSLGLVDAVDFPGWIPRAELHDLRARLAAEGPQRAAQFSWRATAESTLAAIESAVEPDKGA